MIDSRMLERIVQFHGHMCVGLALGIRAAEVGLERVGPNSPEQEMVAIAETDLCGVDAVQFLTGCTFGKGNLIHRDYGKQVYSFVRLSDGTGVRVSAKPWNYEPPDPDTASLYARLQSGTATEEDKRKAMELNQQLCDKLLSMPIEELYSVTEASIEIPEVPRLHPTIVCDSCGEQTAELRMRLLNGQKLCLSCFSKEMSGSIHLSPPPSSGQ